MNVTALAMNAFSRLPKTSTPGPSEQKNENEQTNPFFSNRINKTSAAKPISDPNKWVPEAIFNPIIGLESHFLRTTPRSHHAHRMIGSEVIQ
jgi:hypothetical protein